jgi:hypothetical protein
MGKMDAKSTFLHDVCSGCGRETKLTWYGVRTLFRLMAIGKPKAIDRHFDPLSTLVEDRVVLFGADSFDSAIKQNRQKLKRWITASGHDS